MKCVNRCFIVALALSVPSLVGSQAAPKATQPEKSAAFAVMQANVATITEPDEKARWQANVELWHVMRARTGAPAQADIDKMNALLDPMKANVAAITDPAEKERWQANCDLWHVTVYPSAKASADKPTMQAALKVIEKNVAKVTTAAEKERWMANRDLWKNAINNKYGSGAAGTALFVGVIVVVLLYGGLFSTDLGPMWRFQP